MRAGAAQLLLLAAPRVRVAKRPVLQRTRNLPVAADCPYFAKRSFRANITPGGYFAKCPFSVNTAELARIACASLPGRSPCSCAQSRGGRCAAARSSAAARAAMRVAARPKSVQLPRCCVRISGRYACTVSPGLSLEKVMQSLFRVIECTRSSAKITCSSDKITFTSEKSTCSSTKVLEQVQSC